MRYGIKGKDGYRDESFKKLFVNDDRGPWTVGCGVSAEKTAEAAAEAFAAGRKARQARKAETAKAFFVCFYGFGDRDRT